MRVINRLLAPLIYLIAYTLFRSSIKQRSRKKHNFVMKLFRFAADNGHKQALSVYGHLLHFRGEGVQNKIQGGIYLQQAAQKGDAKAQYQMGKIYEEGFEHYFQPDSSKAFKYYQQAAQQAHQLAVKRLIDIYTQGELDQEANAELAQQWQAKQAHL